MAQILDPLPPNSAARILCCYVNATSKVQIARITNVANWYFERVVFPGQRLIFEAMSEGVLEIHTGMMASAILSDKIPCDRLRVEEDPQAALETQPSKPEDNKSETHKTIGKTAPFSVPVLAAVD
jgi:Domain of unknown function (DUF1830)